MTRPDQPSEQKSSSKYDSHYVFNMTLAAVAGQVGFLTLFVILLSLFGGLWLDNQFDTKPLFTLILLLASVPITLVMMFWIVRSATSRIKPPQQHKSQEADSVHFTGSYSQEEAERGSDSNTDG